MFDLTEDIKSQILELIQPDCNEEQCGWVREDGKVFATPNESPDRAQRSEFDLRDGAIACWHTHWDDSQAGHLSLEDLNNARTFNIPVILYHTGFNEWDMWDPNNPHPYPLERTIISPPLNDIEAYKNLRHHWGRWDCGAVVRSYYLGIKGITLKDVPRPEVEKLAESEWNELPRIMRSLGFKDVFRNEIYEDGDVLLFCIELDKPHHAAVVVSAERNELMHVFRNGLTRIEAISSVWRDRVAIHEGHWRYNC